ncbi:hypothetical protein GCM10029992_44020 [Glycomyces albus]
MWRRPDWRRSAALTAAAALATVAPAALPLDATAPAGDQINVAVVQGNVPRLGLDFNAQRRAVLDNHVQATMELADAVAEGRSERPDIVVWPENASDIDPLANADAYDLISEAAAAIGAPIVLGGIVHDGDKRYNMVIVWDPRTAPPTSTPSGTRCPSPNTSPTRASSAPSPDGSTRAWPRASTPSPDSRPAPNPASSRPTRSPSRA